MQALEAIERPRISVASKLVGLLAVAIFINYVDRGLLGIAGPLISKELHLTNLDFGVLASAFFWSYTLAMLGAGWLAERINPYRTLALGFAIWSVATALTGFVGGFAVLFALRFLLGLGESAAFPCSSKLMSDYLPPQRLGGANGFLIAGVAWGPAFGTLVGGVMMAEFGWRWMFVTFGVVALVWLVPWLLLARQAPSQPAHHATVGAPPSFTEMLSLPQLWGSTLGHFGTNFVLYFVLTWLPIYLTRERGFTLFEMADLIALFYGIFGVSCIFFGWLTDRWIAAGASITQVRKTVFVAGLVGISICLLGPAVGGTKLTVASLLLCGFCFGTNGPSLWSVTQTLAGPRATARWVGVQNGVANFAGIVGPPVIGAVADWTGSFSMAFYLASAVSLLGALAWAILIRRIEPVSWSS